MWSCERMTIEVWRGRSRTEAWTVDSFGGVGGEYTGGFGGGLFGEIGGEGTGGFGGGFFAGDGREGGRS